MRNRRPSGPPSAAAGFTADSLTREFTLLRTGLGLADGIDFHSLRRSYVTHLIEDGYDALFVQQQVGHEHSSTTALYTGVSSDYRTRILRTAMNKMAAEATGTDQRKRP